MNVNTWNKDIKNFLPDIMPKDDKKLSFDHPKFNQVL